MCHIEVWIYPQCMASPVTGPLDVFAIANAIWLAQAADKEQRSPLFSWSLHSPDGAAVNTPTGVSLQADSAINADSVPDVIMLPGIFLGNGMSGLLQAIDSLRASFPLLREKYARGSVLASNCSASFIIAEAGLLDGGHATTAWWLERSFKARYPKVELRLGEVLDEYDNIITSAAATTYLDLSMHLVERFAGSEVAAGVAKTMLIDANRASQIPYISLASLSQQDKQTHDDALVLRAQKWLRKHAQLAFRLPALASHLAVSERTVIRHFQQALGTTPASYAQLLKIDLAKRLLENTTLTLDQVCERTGYIDTGSFRRLFKRHTALSPAQYRLQFRKKKSISNAAASATTT
jgi:transcriptional regulator GlxA family with amidase domain